MSTDAQQEQCGISLIICFYMACQNCRYVSSCH